MTFILSISLEILQYLLFKPKLPCKIVFDVYPVSKFFISLYEVLVQIFIV